MYPKVFHIYGPLEINGYNGAIILGVAIFFRLALRHPSIDKLIRKKDFFNISIESAIVGIIGARILHIISAWPQYTSIIQMFSIWDGGLSILGALVGVFFYSLWSLKQKQLPVLAIYDVAALYAPLLQAFGRIGCFLVGCCYGGCTSVPWAIMYTHPLAHAPLQVYLHPTQLYSSLLFFGIFILLRFFATKYFTRAGEISMLYLMAMSFERWFIDFFRGDRIMLTYPQPFSLFSFHQWLAAAIFMGAFTALLYIRYGQQRFYKALRP